MGDACGSWEWPQGNEAPLPAETGATAILYDDRASDTLRPAAALVDKGIHDRRHVRTHLQAPRSGTGYLVIGRLRLWLNRPLVRADQNRKPTDKPEAVVGADDVRLLQDERDFPGAAAGIDIQVDT